MNKSPYPGIDKIRKKFDADKPLSLREACFVLWGEHGVCSAQYLMFVYWCKLNKLPKDTSMKWKIWYSMFEAFAKNDWETMDNDIDLVVKVSKLGVEGLLGTISLASST